MAEEGSGVLARMKEARIQTGTRLRPRRTVSQALMAELVSKELGRTIHPTQWRRYETEIEPPLDVIRAAAKVSGLSEAYIAFDVTLDDLIDPARDRKLSHLEEQRALRVAEELHREKPGEKPPAKAQKRGGRG